MNKQTVDLLKKIITEERGMLTLDSLPASFNVSRRTFYNYWEEIDDYLNSLHCTNAVCFDGRKFRFTGTPAQRDYLTASINSMTFYEYRLSAMERQIIIATTLITADTPIKNDYFKEIFYVSRNTINNDLQRLRSISNVDPACFQATYAGLVLACSELQKRNLLLQLMSTETDFNDYFMNQPTNPCIAYLAQHLKFDRYRRLAENSIKKAEGLLDLKLSDTDFYRLLTILIFQITRVESGHIIKGNSTRSHNFNSWGQFSTTIFDQLKDEITVNPLEIEFFTKTVQEMDMALKIGNSPRDSVFFSLTIREFLQKISFYYKIDLLSDNLLFEYLCAHITACYHRLKSGKQLDNPYLNETQRQYPRDFEIIKQNIYILENGLNLALNDSETAYILMHILASIERGKFNHYVPNILVTCSAGMATGNFLAMQINRHFRVHLIDVCSVHKMDEMLASHNIDLIISTVPIESSIIPALTVSVILSEIDLARIRACLSELESSQIPVLTSSHSESTVDLHRFTANEKTTFLSLFEAGRIVLDKDIIDWKEGIIAAGELLLWQKKITVNYLHQMIDLVIKYGPYIVIAPGVALAHASPLDGVLEPALSLVRLKTPVCFGDHQYNPVLTILACAVYDTPEYANILILLMTLLRRPDFIQMIQKAENPQMILSYFQTQIPFPSE